MCFLNLSLLEIRQLKSSAQNALQIQRARYPSQVKMYVKHLQFMAS